MGCGVLSVRRQGVVFAAVASAIAGGVTVPQSAGAEEYHWTAPPAPPPQEGSPPAPPQSYWDANNWTPSGFPVAGDVATFALGNRDWLHVVAPGAVFNDQLNVIDGLVGLTLADTDVTRYPTFTLTRADHRALQVGSASSTYGGTAYLDFIKGVVDVRNGGVTVSAASDGVDNRTHAALTFDGTGLSTALDMIIGTEGGSGFVDMHGPARASIGGSALLGAASVLVGRGGDGAWNVYQGYQADVTGDIVIADTAGHSADIVAESGTPTDDRAAYDTGINVAGNLHVGGPAAASTFVGGTGFVGVFDHAYLRSNGDWVLHDAPDVFTGAVVDLYDHAHGAARNVVIGANAWLLVSENSRLDVTGDVTLNRDAFLGVDYGSELVVGGRLIIENGALLSVTEVPVLDANVLNIGQFELGGTTTVRSLGQESGGSLVFDITSLSEFDRLVALSGVLLNGGTLDLVLDSSFTPTEGMTLDLIDTVAIIGNFEDIRFNRPINLNAIFDPNTGAVTFTAVPEPAALAVVALPLALVALGRRRERRAAR